MVFTEQSKGDVFKLKFSSTRRSGRRPETLSNTETIGIARTHADWRCGYLMGFHLQYGLSSGSVKPLSIFNDAFCSVRSVTASLASVMSQMLQMSVKCIKLE